MKPRMTDVVLPPTFETTASFTPGPWDYFVGNANGRGLIRIEAHNSSPDAGHHIASAPRGEVSEANARLIAAAPELLAALRDALRSSRKDFRDGPEGDRQHREAYAEQFAAIAKAKAGAL